MRKGLDCRNNRGGGGQITDIFLSYARANFAKAKSLAKALERSGMSVWWDQQIHGGARFSREIDAALNQAKAVIVLWSRESVESGWVLDEAAAGRDRNRLVPLLLDEVTPPLGFRQFQAISLADWSGRGRPRAMPDILAAVTDLDDFPSPNDQPSATSPRNTPSRHFPTFAAIALIVFLLASAGWLLWQGSEPRGTSASMVVSSAQQDTQSRALAQDLSVDLSRYQSGPLTALAIYAEGLDGPDAPDFLAQVAIAGEGAATKADIMFYMKGRRGIAWSASIESIAGLPDLRGQVAARLSAILPCALNIRFYRGGLTDEAARLFLKACSPADADRPDSGPEANAAIYRRLAQIAPDFGPGIASLAYLQASNLPTDEGPERARLVAEVRQLLDRAKRLDPTIAEIFAAEAVIQPFSAQGWKQSLDLLDRGLVKTPDSPLLLTVKGMALRELGFNAEAIQVMRRALSAQPLSPSAMGAFIDALAYAGQQDQAVRELSRAERIWPRSSSLLSSRFRLEMRYGDPRRALAMLAQEDSRNTASRDWRAFIDARINPTQENIDAALGPFRARYRRDARDVVGYLQNLATFGKIDEAYAALGNPAAYGGLKFGTETLFRAHMVSFRDDPRFLDVAKRLNLYKYWLDNGRWPDFCAERSLPYDCRTGKIASSGEPL